jgi:hypothetical protein
VAVLKAAGYRQERKKEETAKRLDELGVGGGDALYGTARKETPAQAVERSFGRRLAPVQSSANGVMSLSLYGYQT